MELDEALIEANWFYYQNLKDDSFRRRVSFTAYRDGLEKSEADSVVIEVLALYIQSETVKRSPRVGLPLPCMPRRA